MPTTHHAPKQPAGPPACVRTARCPWAPYCAAGPHLKCQVSVQHLERRPHHRHIGRGLKAALGRQHVVAKLGRQQRQQAALQGGKGWGPAAAVGPCAPLSEAAAAAGSATRTAARRLARAEVQAQQAQLATRLGCARSAINIPSSFLGGMRSQRQRAQACASQGARGRGGVACAGPPV